jgi:hypothetical protein
VKDPFFFFENWWAPLYDGCHGFYYPRSALPGAYARFLFNATRGQA